MPPRLSPRGEIRWLLVVLAGSLLLRLALAALAPSPGIADPTYYFNLARNLAEGRGLTDDMILYFHRQPEDVTHPADFYPPLTAALAAAGMVLGGGSLEAALLPFVLLGAIALPLIAWGLAGSLGLEPGTRLLAAAVTAALPELVLSSVRTDTPIVFVPLAGLSLWAMGLWLTEPGSPRGPHRLAVAGALAGLAYLTRLDALLLAPTLLAVFAAALWRRTPGVRVTHLLWFLLPMALVAAPWLLRNRIVLGAVFPVKLGRTMFVTDVLDVFSAGGTFTLESYLGWGVGNILGKVGFEALGNAKMLLVLLAAFAPVALAAALLMVWPSSRSDRPAPLLPAGVFLAGAFVFYTVLAPFFSQSGSFKKVAMAALPFAAVAGARAVEELLPRRRARLVFAASLVAVLLFQSLDLARDDFRRITAYEARLEPARRAVAELGDANGDGRVVLMTQDPFQWTRYGMPSVMLPNDDRETILAVATRYRVDYIVFPADRPALDAVQYGREREPRLLAVWRDARTGMALYRPLPPAGPDG